MEAFESLVKRLVLSLNKAGLDYMFTGALAVSYYGKARTTMDVDVIVAFADKGESCGLVQALKEAGVRADGKRIDDALRSDYRIARFEDAKSPLTVDVILSRERLEKRTGKILGLATSFQPPEDLILAKLRMIKATVPRERALKDREDVKAILKFSKVNVEVVKKKARKEGTLQVYEEIGAGAD